jgi:hypothetical protein
MATYVNNLRLKEIATGDESGTWGTSTNTNLELIGEALGYSTEASFGSDADATTTIADGSADSARALYFKVTSGVSLTATRTLTIAPNTVSKVWIIENATSGSQSINISQGSGANVTVPNGGVKIIYTDGAGAGAAVVDALTDLSVADSLTLQGPTLTIGDATAEDTKIVFDGNAQDYYIGLDDSADDLVIGLGSAVGTTPAISVDENQNVTMPKIVTASTSAKITQVAITSSSNAVAWDAAAAANAYHVTTENTTFSAPSNAVEGAIISVELAQGATPRTIAWNTVFEFAASTAPTVTAEASKTDIFSFRYNGSVWQEVGRVQNLAQT